MERPSIPLAELRDLVERAAQDLADAAEGEQLKHPATTYLEDLCQEASRRLPERHPVRRSLGLTSDKMDPEAWTVVNWRVVLNGVAIALRGVKEKDDATGARAEDPTRQADPAGTETMYDADPLTSDDPTRSHREHERAPAPLASILS